MRERARLRRRTLPAILAVTAIAVGLAPGASTTSVGAQTDSPSVAEDPCAGDGLRNAGFEAGALDGDPACWDVLARSDRVRVVGAEGPEDSPVYADAAIEVEPRGSAMLALGRPKRQAESQATTPDRVGQTFVATGPSVELRLRVFSWEHQGQDAVEVAVDGGASLALALEDVPRFTTGGCAEGACSFEIDTGRRNDRNLLDTGWRTATVSGLQPGSTYTLAVGIGSTENNSFATWGYVDDLNSPPVARYDLDRPEDCTYGLVGVLVEGQPIPLEDCSYDSDGEIVDRRWTITFPEGNMAIDDRRAGIVIPADQGDYAVELTVTDDEGLTDTVTVPAGAASCVLEGGAPGALASDGTCVPSITVQDSPPLVDAVDVQAVAGRDVELVARYGDAGVNDDHAVTVDGASLPRCGAGAGAPCFDEDDLPAVESGIVVARTTAPATPGESRPIQVGVTGTDTGATTTDTATITAIADDARQFEHELATTDDARAISLGARYADWIDRPGDVDLFEVRWPGTPGSPPPALPVGTELLVSLRDLPADYDVAVLVGRGDGAIDDGEVAPGQFLPGQFLPSQFLPGQFLPGQFLPGQFLPGQFLPGQFLPGQFLDGQIAELSRSPGQFLPGQFLPGQFLPGQFLPEIVPGQFLSSVYDLVDPALRLGLAPYAVNPFQLYPLSQREFTGTSGATGTGADVDIDELGLGPVAEGLRVAAYSANRGTDDDSVLVRIDELGSEVYVVVIGANGEFSVAEPYALQVEGSVPFDSVVLAAGRSDLFGGACRRTARGGDGGTTTTAFVDAPGEAETLFVTSWERLEWSARQGDPTAAPVAQPSITALVEGAPDGFPGVGGAVLDVGGPAFAAWDAATCDPSAANAAADVVRDAVLAELAAHDYEHVVVVGGDDVIPFRRVVDETKFANETQYATTSFLEAGQPLFASKAGGYHLTDAHLTDEVPTPWRGRQLWIGDLSTSRLVETEAEIAGQVEAFVGSGGRLDLDTALVTGSEFFDDGAAAIADALGVEGATVREVIDPVDAPTESLRTAADYRCAVFGTGCDEVDGELLSGGVNSVNAHYQHFASFSPRGASTADPAEVIASTEVGDAVAGTLFMTIGCQAGLAVPDDEVQVDEVAPGVRAGLDWAQALAREQAVLIGNTGYGLGEDAGVAYTELLHRFVAEELGVQPTVGDAVREALQRYLVSVTQFDEYHEKTLVQTVLYGLPFYGVGDPASPAPAPADGERSTVAVDGAATNVVGTRPISVTGDVPVNATLQRIETGRGTYYAADGGVLATLERPKQPLVVVPVPDGGPPVHGVLVRHDGDAVSGAAGVFDDEAGFDPVIHAPTSEWLSGGGEPQRCLDAWWPSTLAQVNTLDLGGGELRQTVSVKPGAFRCRSGAAATVTGTQRLFDALPLQLLRSDSDDFQAPVIRQVDFEPAGDGTSPPRLDVTIRLDDPTDAADLAQIVVLRLRAGTITSEDQAFDVDGADVAFALADLRADEGILIQLVDGAGNVTTYTGKSTIPSVIGIEATGPAVAVEGEPVTLTAVIPGYTDKVASGELVEPVWYSWDFGAAVAFEGRTTSRASGLVTAGTSAGTTIRFEDADGDGRQDAVVEVTAVYDGTAPDPIVTTARVVDSDGGIGLDDHVMRLGCDAADVPDYPDADLIGCGVDLGAATGSGEAAAAFTVTVAGTISPEYQYRVGFDTDANGGVDKTVKYADGKLSGALDATAELGADARELLVTVALADVVTVCPDDATRQCVIWQIETQGGVAGGQGLGFLDRARDELTVSVVP